MPEPYYCTAAELRTELGVDAVALPDADAVALIETAEDLVDEELGARPVDDTTGRKVVQADEDAWRWTKLKRATVKLAALLHRQPDVAQGPQWRSISGPDYSTSDPFGSRFGDEVAAPLNQSGLRRVTTSIGGRGARPPWYGFAYNDPDEV